PKSSQILACSMLCRRHRRRLLRLCTDWVEFNLDVFVVGSGCATSHRVSRLQADPVLSRVPLCDALIGIASPLFYFAVHYEVIVLLDAVKPRGIRSIHFSLLLCAVAIDGGEDRWPPGLFPLSL